MDDIQPEGVSFTRADLVLLRRATAANWGVPDAVKNEAIFQCAKILAPPGKERLKLSAMRLLAALDRTDLMRARVQGPEPPTDARPRLIIPGADE